MSRVEPPEDWRELDVANDDSLRPEEKEFTITGPNDLDTCLTYSDIPTIIRYFQSIDEYEPKWVRLNNEGEIIGINGVMPKGMITLRSKAKSQNTHSSLVVYGPHYSND